ncbi:hypothetical protein, partial [Klebsiella variicola]|uniref:hypothetical protein n=1 Tax=Klebsiella variicola TaxID=244366 RepID=UPI00272F26B5
HNNKKNIQKKHQHQARRHITHNTCNIQINEKIKNKTQTHKLNTHAAHTKHKQIKIPIKHTIENLLYLLN